MAKDELVDVRCPGLIYKFNSETNRKEFVKCNSLLFRLNKGGKCETVCRRCKSKITAVIRQTIDDNIIIDLRQRQNDD